MEIETKKTPPKKTTNRQNKTKNTITHSSDDNQRK